MHTEEKVPGPVVSTDLHKIRQIRFLTERTFVLRFDRGNMQFKAGQHIIAGLEGELDQREYSVYSGENDDCLEMYPQSLGSVNQASYFRLTDLLDLSDLKHSKCSPGNWYL
jgi:hypothetical protein